ncbi:MAG: hypothetical protein CMJ46_05445, partial [Planctomyces sp.]|nr:hypothetical protein [Planctomyces sp.]
MSRLPLPSRHRIAIPVCLFVGLICLSSSSSAQLQEMTTEAWIEAIDDAFDAPEKELLPSAAVFPMVDETGKICENGLGVSSHANYLYEFCPHRMSHTSALWYHVVFRGGGEHLAGFEIDEAEIELYAASLDADYYYFPMLTEVAGGYELVIQRAFAGELEQEEIYRGTLTEAEYPSLANRIAAEMFKDRGAKLTPEEQAYLDRPQLKDREAADQFGKLSDGSLKEDEMLDLLRENPTCFAAWMTTISSEIKKDSCLEELVKHKDEVDIDLIIYFNSFAFEAIETDQLLLMLNRAPELKSNVDYSRSLSQYLFMECESEVDDHFISVWAGMADSYSELHVLSRAVRRLGWNVRGGGSVAQTPPEAMLVFGERSKEAYGYAQEALQINPEGWQTHLMGIEYGTEAGGQEIARQHFNSLIELRPRCRKAWKAYFRAMQPRWGGELKNSLEFAMRCAESDDWDLGIPQLSIAMLQDLADPAYIRGFSHETFANELVWAVARTYYERALA